jgi:hypothetical protein
MHKKFWSENLKGRGHLGDLGIGGLDNIKMDLRNRDWIYVAQDRNQPVSGFCGYGNEPSGPVKGG